MEAPVVMDQNMATQFALRVALQTMKERCVSLQKRITAVEEENQELRDRLNTGASNVKGSNSSGSMMDNYQLRSQVQELNRQKTQLSEHINMVSAENRKLWSRLSQISKEQNSDNDSTFGQAIAENNCTLPSETQDNLIARTGCSNLNLIRSKTFTQHSPNPNLRHKVISCKTASDDMADISFEDVSLGRYEENQIGAGESYAVDVATEADLAFSYLNEEGSEFESDSEIKAETKKCIAGLEEIRHEALLQQHELKATLKMIQTNMTLNRCRECENKSKKPEMADKSLETDESLSDIKLCNAAIEEKMPCVAPQMLHTTPLRSPTECDKICPMCAKTFATSVPFNTFREHVETHFIDVSSDIEQSIDRNFEFISHTVGDF